MRILVATDGSRGGAAAVKFAARLASGDHGSELVILTIAKPEDAAQAGPPEATRRRTDLRLTIDMLPTVGRHSVRRKSTVATPLGRHLIELG